MLRADQIGVNTSCGFLLQISGDCLLESIMRFKVAKRALVVACLANVGPGQIAQAASGEMGTGVPLTIGSYSAPSGVQTYVWSLAGASVPFPAGCTLISLSAATMGMDAYKIAYATLLFAKATNRAVRFYAHAVRDGGCGVDYIQLSD